MLFSGGIPGGDLRPLEFTSLTDDENDTPVPLAWVDDLDGDAVPDLAMGPALVPSGELARGGAWALADVRHLSIEVYAGALTIAATDMTGDGLPERVLHELYWYPEGSDHYYNRVLIIEGFDIPWDDPSKW